MDTKHYDSDGVVVWEFSEANGTYLAVMDDAVAHYRITLSAQNGRYRVGIAAAFSDDGPVKMANYSEYAPYHCALEEIQIDDNGLLVVMAKHETASTVDIRSGFTAQLPTTFVEPMRLALKRVVELAQQNNS